MAGRAVASDDGDERNVKPPVTRHKSVGPSVRPSTRSTYRTLTADFTHRGANFTASRATLSLGWPNWIRRAAASGYDAILASYQISTYRHYWLLEKIIKVLNRIENIWMRREKILWRYRLKRLIVFWRNLLIGWSSMAMFFFSFLFFSTWNCILRTYSLSSSNSQN